MKTNLLCRTATALCCTAVLCSAQARRLPYQDKRLPVAERVADLIGRMTLDEKIAELNLLPYYAKSDSSIRAAIRQGRVGALLKANGAALNLSLQKEALKHSRLGIPLMFHEDVIHGYRTLSPIPLAESCSWDTALVASSAAAAAREAAAAGIQLAYGPMVDISYDPRWGRIMETSGEDAFLGACMSAARVYGYQGKSLADTETLAACVKHYAGYGALLAGRDYQNTDFSLRDLRERYLPPFQAAVDAGVASVMCSYTSYDGEPVTMNRFLCTDVLRGELRFGGLLMSDWTTLSHAVSEGAAADGRESSERGIKAGIEMDMASRQYATHLRRLVEEGKVPAALIDSAAAHALALKFRAGLFDRPYDYFDERRERAVTGSEPIRKAVFDMACASMVLLRNENEALPLRNGERIALVGPFAAMQNDLLGAWTMMGKGKETVSVVQGLRKRIGEDRLIDAGCAWNGLTDEYLKNIGNAVGDATTVVACLGEYSYRIGEGVTTGRLELPEEQIRLLQNLRATGKRIVVVLFNGRPLVLGRVAELCDAILEAWYPGTMGGDAVAALLTGEKAPVGKLTQTFPRHAGQVPIAYNFRRTFGRVLHSDLPKGAQYPFGFGLTYTTFSYGKPVVARTEYTEGDTVRVTVRVTNTGKRAGREVVQLYIRDEVATVVPREKELRGFKLTDLAPGESRDVVFDLSSSCFKIYDNRMRHVLEPGKFRILTGTDSEQLQETSITFR